MNLVKSLSVAIDKYGLSCKVSVPSKTLTFKGIIFNTSNIQQFTNEDFLHIDPSAPSRSTLIITDFKIINYLHQDLIVTTPFSTFQILKCEKFAIADQLIYLSISLLPIKA